MIRVVLFFAVIFACFYFGIPAFRQLSGREQLEITKLFTYSVMCTALTVIAMTIFVYAF